MPDANLTAAPTDAGIVSPIYPSSSKEPLRPGDLANREPGKDVDIYDRQKFEDD